MERIFLRLSEIYVAIQATDKIYTEAGISKDSFMATEQKDWDFEDFPQ